MRPVERENRAYNSGKINRINSEERIMFRLLQKSDRAETLLDVGCGEGSVSLALKKKGYDVKGVDFSPVGVNLCKAKGIEAEVANVDDGLPFQNQSFDVVWMGDILEHVFDPIYLLKESGRVLKNNGYILLTTPNELWWPARINALFGRSSQSGVYRNFGQCKHHTVMSLELLEYFVFASGLKIKNFYGIIDIPIIKKDFISKMRHLSSVFARVFVLKIVK